MNWLAGWRSAWWRGYLVVVVAGCFANERATAADSRPVPAGAIPVADFFRAPLMARPRLNPAGTHLATLADSKDDQRVAIIVDLATDTKRMVSGGDERDIYDATWLDDRHLLLSQSKEKIYADGLFVADLDDTKRTYVVEASSAVQLIGVPRQRPLQPIIWLVQDAFANGRDGGAMRIDASKSMATERDPTGMLDVRMPGDSEKSRVGSAVVLETYAALVRGRTAGYMADNEGELAYAVVVDDDGRPGLKLLQAGTWVRSPLDLDAFELIDVGDQAGELWMAGPAVEGKTRPLVRVDTRTGAVVEAVHRDPDFDCNDAVLIRNPETRAIVGFQFKRDAPVTIWLDQARADRQRKLDELLPGLVVSVVGVNGSEDRLVVAAFSDRSPPAYYLVDLTKPSLARLGSTAPWIDPLQMQPMQVMRFKNREGVPLAGYLTLPAGASKESPAPLVVLPHGGPWARDQWGWDGEVQFLASRGYAVFQPNYRGSTGSCWRFPDSDRWEFMKMHQDVTDGVRKLLRTGLIDPRRVAIMGTSFGGYLAVCGVVEEPDLYRCAVTVAGVFDWALMLRSARADLRDTVNYAVLRRRLGDPRQQEERFEAMSPLHRIERVQVPVFVAHGRSDNVVDEKQSRRLVQELEKNGIPHERFFRSGEGHGMVRLDDRVELYTAIEKFLAENLRSVTAPQP